MKMSIKCKLIKKREETEQARNVAKMGKIRNMNPRRSPFGRHAYKGR